MILYSLCILLPVFFFVFLKSFWRCKCLWVICVIFWACSCQEFLKIFTWPKNYSSLDAFCWWYIYIYIYETYDFVPFVYCSYQWVFFFFVYLKMFELVNYVWRNPVSPLNFFRCACIWLDIYIFCVSKEFLQMSEFLNLVFIVFCYWS